MRMRRKGWTVVSCPYVVTVRLRREKRVPLSLLDRRKKKLEYGIDVDLVGRRWWVWKKLLKLLEKRLRKLRN